MKNGKNTNLANILGGGLIKGADNSKDMASPVIEKRHARNDANFISTLQSALGANPIVNTASERYAAGINHQGQQSFTIPCPTTMGNNHHKESWFGSFGNYGGRKSTENVFQKRQSFSLGPNENRNTNTGMNHKFSLVADIFN